MTPIVIVGCGGFGREVHDVVDAVGSEWDLVGYVDDAPSPANVALVERRGARVIGGTSWLAAAPPETRYVIGIGSGSVRRAVDDRLNSAASRQVSRARLEAALPDAGVDIYALRSDADSLKARLDEVKQKLKSLKARMKRDLAAELGMDDFEARLRID